MRVIEKLRTYIGKEIGAGRLHPGDRLPSLRSLTGILGGSYVTMHSAMEKLGAEGIVEVRNTGTYLSGTNRIRVLVNYPGSDLPRNIMIAMLKKHLVNTELYLDLEVRGNGEIRSLEDLQKIEKNYSACVTVGSPVHSRDDHLPAANLKEFSDYAEHFKTLAFPSSPDCGCRLPFSFASECMGINRSLMEKIGFDWSKIDSSFHWWEEYVGKCRKAKLPPSVICWDRKQLFFLSPILHPVLSFCGFSREKIHGKEPCFNTPGGRRLLEIMDQVSFAESQLPLGTAFFRNETPFIFQIGSWLSMQNNNPDYPDVTVDSPEIIPYRDKTGKSLFVYGPNVIEAWFRKDLVFEERKRVWKLIKIMTGREFQLDYCGKTGMISPVKDIYPTEYYWNRDGRWNAFFPGENDTLIDRNLLFNRNIYGILSTILESHFFDGVVSETVLRLLDLKKMFPKRNK